MIGRGESGENWNKQLTALREERKKVVLDQETEFKKKFLKLEKIDG